MAHSICTCTGTLKAAVDTFLSKRREDLEELGCEFFCYLQNPSLSHQDAFVLGCENDMHLDHWEIAMKG